MEGQTLRLRLRVTTESQMDAYLFRMGAPEPEGAAERGLYVDGIYF